MNSVTNKGKTNFVLNESSFKNLRPVYGSAHFSLNQNRLRYYNIIDKLSSKQNGVETLKNKNRF